MGAFKVAVVQTLTRARLSKATAQVQAVWVQPGEGRVLASLDRFGRC